MNKMNLVSDLELDQAMLRRALALDLVGLTSFSTVQRWVERLFEIANQDPPPSFMRVSSRSTKVCRCHHSASQVVA